MRGTPETSPYSLACVRPHENMQYFAGGFNGGTSSEYLKMAKSLSDNIENDYSRGVIAIWHDESHINRYFIDNPPTKILSPSYCYAESWDLPFEKKLLALDKNHAEVRS
jgi:histo-blood group ABO system transferase